MSRLGRIALLGALGMGSALLAACGSGVPQADLDAAKQQAATAQAQLAAKSTEATNLQGTVTARDKQIADLQAKSGSASAQTVLMAVEPKPTRVPSAPPTPLPAGAPTATPVAEPAYLQEKVPFAFFVDTLATTSVNQYGLAATVPCVPNAVYKRGMKVIWIMEAVDVSTGKRVTDMDGLVKVHLPNGTDVNGRFRTRGGTQLTDAPWIWYASWDIPPDYPLGNFDYSLVVTMKDGRTSTYSPPWLNDEGKKFSYVRVIA